LRVPKVSRGMEEYRHYLGCPINCPSCDLHGYRRFKYVGSAPSQPHQGDRKGTPLRMQSWPMVQNPFGILGRKNSPKRIMSQHFLKAGQGTAFKKIIDPFREKRNIATAHETFLAGVIFRIKAKILLGDLRALSEAGGSQSFNPLPGQVRLNRMTQICPVSRRGRLDIIPAGNV
jgi:hypothetical protein